jgi:hypothetical protein
MSMTHAQQAELIWPVLAFAARMQRVLTYGELDGFTGIPATFQGDALHLIHLYCRRNDYALLNSIVVSQDTGYPGDGFPEKLTRTQLLEERARVFTYPWSVREKPRSEDFVMLRSAVT